MEDAIPQVKIDENVTFEKFRDEILPGNVRVVLKGVVAHWPAVRDGAESSQAMADYLRRFDQGKPVETIFRSPDKALDALRESADGIELEEVGTGSVRFGRRTQAWQWNRIALGSAALVIDPIAASNLHFLRSAIDRLLKLLLRCDSPGSPCTSHNGDAITTCAMIPYEASG